MRKIYQKIRRLAAVLLALSLVCGLAWPGGAFTLTAFASTELPSENLGDGASDTLGYKWKSSNDYSGWGGVAYRYDLNGLRAGETNYEQGSMGITYGAFGFPTYLVMAGLGRNTPPSGNEIPNQVYDPSVLLPAGFYMAKLGQRDEAGNKITNFNGAFYNGAVEKLTFGSGGSQVELESRITTTASSDGKYVFVDYYLCHVGGNLSPEGETFWLASPFDLMVNGSLQKDVYKTSRGFYALDVPSKSTVDVITNDSSLGITVPPDTRWVGPFSPRVQQMLTESAGDSALNSDNSLAYSWKFKIRPYETIHRRIAFTTKEAAYYVSSAHGDDLNPNTSSLAGTYKQPFKTIEYALSQCNGKNAYIYIQDYDSLDHAVDLAPSGFAEKTSIVISSSDMDINGNSTVDSDNYIKVLRRADGYTGNLFRQSRNAVIQFSDITLDGSGTAGAAPIIEATAGTLQVNGGTTLQNNTGGAIAAEGSSNLYMNGSEAGTVITDNTSEKGAVYFNSTGKFTVLNHVTIKNNKKPDETPANVYLPNGKYMTVAGDLGDSSIGVTTESIPTASPEGNSIQADQEITIAVPSDGYPAPGASSPFADNFTADLSTQGLFTSAGSQSLGTGVDTVIKRYGYTMSFVIVDADTGGSVPGAPVIPVQYFAPGDAVTVNPPGEVTGYRLDQVTIDQGSGTSLTYETAQGDNYGRITGAMPAQEVVISYQYAKSKSTISFQANGGTPQPPMLEGKAGFPVNSLLPGISRYGYLFRGWSTVNDWENPDFIAGLPAVFGEAPVTYYAVFEPDPSVKFNYTVEYSNQAGDIIFQTGTAENAYSVEAAIQAQRKEIHGYTWSLADSGTTPTEYNYSGTSLPIGQFNGSTGTFTGTMPGQDATVRYRYTVDYGNTAAQSLLTVRHETAGGTVVSDAQTSGHYPEESVTAQPVTKYGYECVDVRIDAGNEADDTDGHLVSGLQGDFDDNRVFHGVMPNQPVTITYLYEPTEEGYPLTVEYLDNGTSDERLTHIQEPLVHLHQAEETVGLACAQGAVTYQQPYGYQLAAKSISPSTTLISWNGNDFTGTMPNDSETVTYRHSRVPALWADITYLAGAHGSLMAEEGMSPDVQAQGDGSFKTSALIDNGTEQGAEGGYTLSGMKERRLMPGTEADTYYRFGGWFVDGNHNGMLDNGETLLEEGDRFTGAEVLTAYFEEDPSKWVDIHFEAGAHGSIRTGEALSLHTTYDKKWSDITGSLPQYVPEVNYLTDRWYAGQTPVTGETGLVNGQVYTIRFRPDPDVFGTDVAQPETLAGLNTRGKGRITVFNTTPGYQYILTDPSGKILEVIRGNELTERAVFDNLYPGAEYRIYEAADNTVVQAGDTIEEVTDPLSAPAEVLTPVLETNYQIIYDEEEEGKTVLVIKPADPDSEYAVLDKNGHVVNTPPAGNGGFKKPAGSPAFLTFAGLDYNCEYTVVARPLGKTDITAESLIDKGSVITTDPGGELELTNYIVETQNGEIKQVGGENVGSGRYEEAHKGDRVQITADAVNGAGEAFSHWETTIGTAGDLGDKTTRREASFTMPDANVVLTAVYERPKASPSNAAVVDEVRGGSRKETALDPNEIPRLEEELTTEADEELMDVNHADVTYKVVYRKNAVKASESNAVKASGSYETDHEAAYKGAWGLDVLIERYVNGRKVAGDTEPEASFRTYIQMGKGDVDMLDYQLYEITENPGTGEAEAALVSMEQDPEETGGLYAFTAHAGSRYVMVYNRAYRVYFINNVALPLENRYRYYFKVRRDESPEDEYYHSQYGQVAEQLEYFVNPDGAEFRYEGWSYSQDRYKEFNPSSAIYRKTYLYAYYKDNVKEVDDARKELEDAIKEAIRVSDDHFLKQEESGKLKEAVEEALEVLDRENPRATAGQLEEALEKLKEKTEPYEEILDDRYNHYDDIQDNGNKGGNKGGGGSGSGSKQNPFNTKRPESYTLGTNGNWVEISAPVGGERQIAFVLNGGMRLSGMWAWIKYPADGSGNISDRTGWYHFNDKGIMETGWIRDESGNWYYCNTEKEGRFGKMQTGWRHDGADGNWYYLIPEGGAMATGWRKIGEKWYYFETAGAGVYAYDPVEERWNYGGGSGKPLGSMYKNEMTPDGYAVDSDGVWIP